MTTYRKTPDPASGATPLFMIVADDDWRESILCVGMYEHTADWLLNILAKHTAEHDATCLSLLPDFDSRDCDCNEARSVRAEVSP